MLTFYMYTYACTIPHIATISKRMRYNRELFKTICARCIETNWNIYFKSTSFYGKYTGVLSKNHSPKFSFKRHFSTFWLYPYTNKK